jgi:DNA-binding XRE family transcriptional regulator
MPCSSCGGPQVASHQDQPCAVDGVAARVRVSAMVCSQCGRVEVDAPTRTIDRAFARYLARTGVVTGATLRRLREAAAVQSQRMAALLNVRRETLSRWENGNGTVDRTAWLVVGAMLEDEFEGRSRTRERLHAAAAPNLPKTPPLLGIDGLEIPAEGLSATARRSRRRKR